jgi:hypothetical protein
MRKAYDRVEWSYLEAIMLKLGFHPRWVRMTTNLVTVVSFQVLFNGSKLEPFNPSWGICQGDPISPYLFLITGEGLSCPLKDQSESSLLHGIKVPPSTPMVNHLLFTDDSLLLFSFSSRWKLRFSSARDFGHLLCDIGIISEQGQIFYLFEQGMA